MNICLTVNGEFRLLVDFVEPDRLLQLALGADRAGVALLVDPLHGEGVGARESADLAHLGLQVVVLDRVIDVRDKDLTEKKFKDLVYLTMFYKHLTLQN